MSTPSGPPPGWYRAADGRWYPPPAQQQYPPHRYGPPQQHGGPPQQYAPPQHGAPPPAPRRRGPGRALVVVGIVVVVLVVLGAVAVNRLVTGIGESVGGLAGGTGCDAVSTEAVDGALGGSYDVVQLGALGAVAAPVLDSRVLADAPSCWAVESGDGGRLARIARYSGPDAADRFAAERAAAMGTTEDRGGGITVSAAAYFNKDVPAGDEAFCTTGDFTASAGVLVRTGDLLVYVSTTAAGDGAESIPDIEFDPAGGASDAIRFGTDDANCDRAVALAAQVR
ncbi:hypothetical protein GCM10017691_32690 [Pseudonocardia petroleophila]|uniref:Uncharacterized protein n=1 Tax=Pseudonocardia petroleophila TaxID=37331 RepID=A0A7G7MDQ7_9PSEU|nr:hypothetical protein [Pseudonocardia petroleophila]QNG50918.1 hypothetical protein H6H00_22365 [Pseudonocardia petroleophila]